MMLKKLLLTALVFAFVAALTFIVGAAASPAVVALPKSITAHTPCPVAGCTQAEGVCHANDAYPEPDGSFAMFCPRINDCSDAQCHAWERIDAARSKPSDVAMNLWILAPVVLILVLVGVVRKL